MQVQGLDTIATWQGQGERTQQWTHGADTIPTWQARRGQQIFTGLRPQIETTWAEVIRENGGGKGRP